MKSLKPLMFASLVTAIAAAPLANANPLLDQLLISQANPALVPAFQTQGSIVNFYGENYVVNNPVTCNGPTFYSLCTVGLAHLSANPSVTVQINQVQTQSGLITSVSAKPDGKTYNLTYLQKAPGAALNVVNIQRTDNN